MGDFEVAVSSCSFGVDYSFWDSFPIEMGEFVDKVEIGEHDGSIGSCGDRVLVVIDG